MLRYDYEHHAEVAWFTAQLIPHVRARGFGRCKAIGVIDEEGKPIAGIVYHNFDPESGVIEMSGAATTPRWLTRETLERMYSYPFLQIGCQMVLMRVAAENERLLRQLAAYGYMLINVPRMFGRDRDGVICLLTYEDWIGNKFNKRLRRQLAAEAPIEEAA